MISETSQLPLGGLARHRKSGIVNRNSIRAVDWNFYIQLCHRYCAPVSSQEPFDWCVDNVIFADTEVTGPFNPIGREFLRDIINDIDDTENREHTLICSAGVGKTLAVICRHVWTIVHNPRRGMMSMPSTKNAGGSETYVTSRFIPCLAATAATRDLMDATDRHAAVHGKPSRNLNSKKVRINGSHIDFVGGKSASAVASNRCSLIDVDELDKQPAAIGNEAGLKKLIAKRTEGVRDYTVFQNTTPTIETGTGWKCLLRSDFRRRFLPCPHCNSEYRHRELLLNNSISDSNLKGWMDLAWNEQYCVLPSKFARPPGPENGLNIPRAYVRWGEIKDGKNTLLRKNGEWDRDGVVRSTRLECPHCGGHITDEQKFWMDKNGVWVPLQENHGHKGNHLSALYAPPLVSRDEDPKHQSRLAGRALQFIEDEGDGESMKDFVNSILGEVDVRQQHGKSVIEISSAPMSQPDWIALLTADFHKNAPYIWFTVRKWCAFKLAPPVILTDGKPEFVAALDLPGNEDAKKTCEQLVGKVGRDSVEPKSNAVWQVVGELARFNATDPATGRSPLVDFLLAQKITGEKLVKFFREQANGDTMEFRRLILLEMFRQAGGDEKNFRAARGGDSELIAAGNIDNADCWQELRNIEKEFHVGQGLRPDQRAVFIDCGYQDKFDAEVLRECYDRAEHFKHWDVDSPRHAPFTYGWWEKGADPTPKLQGKISLPCAADGWLPLQGIPTFQPQGDGKLSRELSHRVADPFYGTGQNEGTRVIEVLRAPQMLFWKRRQDLRERKTRNTWGISPNVSWWPKEYDVNGNRLATSRYTLEEFLKQSDGQYYDEQTRKVEPKGGRGGSQSKKHPYHPDDCETYQVVGATLNEFFQAA